MQSKYVRDRHGGNQAPAESDKTVKDRVSEGERPWVKRALEQKYDSLCEILRKAGSAVICFSGGVDSTFLLKVGKDMLGDRIVAVTARSETFPARELREAETLAQAMECEHILIESEELKVPGFSNNPPERCFLCKNELFSKVKAIADARGIPWVFDGSNAEDSNDFRPGRAAARRLGIRSPLEEARLNKDEIRLLSKRLGLPTWDKPSFACLSSRFPYHTPITRPALQQVERAENYLWDLGMRVFRVRHHGPLARLELGENETALLGDPEVKDRLIAFFKSIGYTYVALDLEGYRTGSMNETLPQELIGPKR